MTVDFLSKTQKVYSGTLTAGVSPLTLPVLADLGGMGGGGSITISTGGDITCSIETNEGDWGTAFTIVTGESMPLNQFQTIRQIKITRGSSDATYRVIVRNPLLKQQHI